MLMTAGSQLTSPYMAGMCLRALGMLHGRHPKQSQVAPHSWCVTASMFWVVARARAVLQARVISLAAPLEMQAASKPLNNLLIELVQTVVQQGAACP